MQAATAIKSLQLGGLQSDTRRQTRRIPAEQGEILAGFVCNPSPTGPTSMAVVVYREKNRRDAYGNHDSGKTL